MKKELLILLIITGLTSSNFIKINSNETIVNLNISDYSNFYANLNNLERPRDKEKIEKFWTDENESFLSPDEKEILNELRSKVESGENLTIEQRDILSTLRGETIRKKLGDIRFERYKKLIEKREKQEKGKLEIELTKEEKAEIYNFEKEINGK